MSVRSMIVLMAVALCAEISVAQRVDWTISRGVARVVDGRTVLPIEVTFRNGTPNERRVSAKVSVVDYFQNSVADEGVECVLKPGEAKTTGLAIVTDEAGPYVKVAINGVETVDSSQLGIGDEQLVFTDVLSGPRLHLSLNGAWERCPDEAMNLKRIPDGPWTACELPYRWLTWGGIHTYWFRKSVELPAEMSGKRIELKLNGVRFHVAVFLNGRLVGKGHTDQMPFAVNLTRAAKVGQTNELTIAVTDWVSCGAPELQGQLRGVWSSAWMQGREIPGMPLIRPCTMGIGAAGISDPLSIVATSDVSIEACRITPSVRKSQLQVQTVVKNVSDGPRVLTLRLGVFGQTVDVPVTAKVGENCVETVIPVDLKTITLWQVWRAKLYRFRAELIADATVCDRMDSRFGFREFWADGPVFRMNGVAMRPNAASPIPFDLPGIAHYDEKSRLATWNATKQFVRSFEGIHVNLVRYHSEPYPILMFDLADELGLPVVSEAYMATLPGKLKMDDPRLWKTMAEFYPKWVYREFNHPSLVIRSMENELGYHLPAADAPRSPWGYSNAIVEMIVAKMKELGRLVKSIDPSRPIMYEGSGPVFYDVADIYNVHYPWIAGGENLFPITGRRMSIPSASYREKSWLWDRKKPLFIGEYDCCFGEPKHFAPELGNDAYRYGYLHIAHGMMWSYTIPGHRIDGVTCGVPWTILTFNDVGPILHESNGKIKLFKDLTLPIASFVHQYREVYFGGRTIRRTITTLNDSLAAQAVTLRWSLVDEGGAAVRSESTQMELSPAESRVTQISVALPTVERTTRYRLVAETLVGDAVVQKDERVLQVWPDRVVPVAATSRIGVVGVAQELLKRVGVACQVLDATKLDLSAIDVLLIDGELSAAGARTEIERFVRDGGRVMVLGGSKSPDFLPVTLPMTPTVDPVTYTSDVDPSKTITIATPGAASTLTFPLIPEHPLLSGLDASMLRFWREDHLTIERSYMRPNATFARYVIACGSGLEHSPLLEVPLGRGVIVACQMPVAACYDDQPAARQLWANLLTYADMRRASSLGSAVGVLADAKSPIADFVRSLSVEPFVLTGKLAEIKSLSAYAVLMVEPTAAICEELTKNKAKIDAYVAAGGAVWVCAPTPEMLSQLQPMLPVTVTLQKLERLTQIMTVGRDLYAGMTNDAVFWPEGSFLPTISPRVAAYAVVAEGDQAIALAEPAVAMTIASGRNGGRWLIDGVAWANEFTERTRAQHYVRTILMNAGVQADRVTAVGAKVLDASRGYAAVDIASLCNEGYTGGVWNGPTMGLLRLPIGEQVFGGVPFSVIDPAKNAGKGCVGFHSEGRNKTGVKTIAVPIDRQAAAVHLLLTSIWTSSLSAGSAILKIDVAYADGSTVQSEVCYGRDVLDWCPADFNSTRTHPAVVWIGKEWPTPGLYDYVWLNPHPEKSIATMTRTAANETGFAVLLAVTTQQKLSDKQKKTSDWIPGLER